MLCAVYNCIGIPVNVAYPGSFLDHLTFTIIDYVIDFAMLFDIIINFRTSYLNSKTGDEVFQGSLIAI